MKKLQLLLAAVLLTMTVQAQSITGSCNGCKCKDTVYGMLIYMAIDSTLEYTPIQGDVQGCKNCVITVPQMNHYSRMTAENAMKIYNKKKPARAGCPYIITSKGEIDGSKWYHFIEQAKAMTFKK